MRRLLHIVGGLLAVLLLTKCATYYQKSYKFQQDFSTGNLEQAKAFLEHNKKAEEKKDRLLYFFDRGVVEQMLGNYEESNAFLEKAYTFSQDFRKSFTDDVMTFIANPMLKPYEGEDFELVLLHFYKAINFIHLDDLDAALIEARRINVKLNEINDKYKYKKNRYKEDAFAHQLMGLIYEAQGDDNNAFIAFRNAYNLYNDLYEDEFDISPPIELKKDLLRSAARNNFMAELTEYEEQFDMTFTKDSLNTGSFVFFWLNGLGPVKSEFSLNLSRVQGDGGFLTFANEQEGFSIPYTENSSYYSTDPSEFSDLKFVRMAIPKYNKRMPLLDHGFLEVNHNQFVLKKVEDVEAIAVSTLQDRMLREISKSIGRLALKQATELAAREENENLGTLVSLVNAATEKADTRNWQTLPNSIYYQKLTLAEGNHTIDFISKGKDFPSDTVSFKVNIEKGKTVFRSYHTLESGPPIP